MKSITSLKSMKIFFGFLALFFLAASPVYGAKARVTNETTGQQYTSLQSAIDAANSGDVLKLKGHFYGTFFINKSLSLIGSPRAVLDGNYSVRVLDLGTNGSAVVNLENLVIQNGSDETGGGILNIGILNIKNLKIINNVSTENYGGGGIGNWASNPETSVSGVAALTVVDTEFINNKALSGEGGGIVVQGGTLTMENSLFENNYALSFGGGVALCASTNIICNTTFKKNTTPGNGGGVGNDRGGITTLNYVTFEGNTAANGGGVSQVDVSTLINHGYFKNNIATNVGGGFAVLEGIGTLNDSEVVDNKAGVTGGGVYAGSGTDFLINRSEVEDNSPNDIFD